MCGRYAFYSPHEAVIDVFGPLDGEVELKARYNITPSQQVAIVRARKDGRRELANVQWGLVPYWAKERAIGHRLINARVESLAEKPAFRDAYRLRRCLVLADGYYEWQSTQAPKQPKQPYFVATKAHQPFGMAALWESWTDPGSGERLRSCVIITTDANALVKPIHARMPVIVPKETHAAWLDPGAAFDLPAFLAGPASAVELEARAVSRRVNSPAEEGPELIAAAETLGSAAGL